MRMIPFSLIIACVGGPLAADAPTGAQCLLLDSHQVLTGQIERTADGYRVRRRDGETVVPQSQVLLLCADRRAAYEYLQARCPRDSGTERLKLAVWCRNNDLPEEALEEARAAAALRPNHVPTQRFLKLCASSAERPPAATPRPSPPPVLPESVDCSPNALAHFRTRVQPVLMNACAQCHTNSDRFPLQRVAFDSTQSRAGTFHNLSASMAQVDRARPMTSALLVKALAAHGGSPTPPLRDRGNPAYLQLERWVQMLTEEGAVTVVAPPATEPAPSGVSGFAGGRSEEKPSTPADPFDPGEFNKKVRPPKP